MTDYNAILQTVNGKVYELKGLDSAFHLHQPASGIVGFYAPEHYNNELFIHLKGGDQFIFEKVPEDVLAALEPNDANIDRVYQNLMDTNHPKRVSDAEVAPVDLKELVDVFCQMQYHITTTNGLWATDRPDALNGDPAHQLLWQITFKQENTQSKSYESRT